MACRRRALGDTRGDHHLGASMLEFEHLLRNVSGAAFSHGCQQRLARQRSLVGCELPLLLLLLRRLLRPPS